MTEPIATSTLPYAIRPRELVCEKTDNGLQIYIPFRVREKLAAATGMLALLLIASVCSVYAAFYIISVLGTGFGLALLLVFGGIIFLLTIVCVLMVWLTQRALLEYDGNVLRAGGYASSKVLEWPRGKIRKVSILRWPLLPVANVCIQVGYDTVRIGFYHPKQLAEAVSQLREAMGLEAT